MNGKGWAGSIASGVSTGKMLALEHRLQPAALGRGDVDGVEHLQALGGQLARAGRRQIALLVGHQGVGGER